MRIWRRQSWTGYWSVGGGFTSGARRTGPDTWTPRAFRKFREQWGQSYVNAQDKSKGNARYERVLPLYQQLCDRVKALTT